MGGGHEGYCGETLGATLGTVGEPVPGQEVPIPMQGFAWGGLIPTASWGPGLEWGMWTMSLISRISFLSSA